MVRVGKGDKGQEDQASDGTNDQAQHAAMYLHGLAALARVEKGMSRDAPVEQSTESGNYLDCRCVLVTRPTSNSNNSTKQPQTTSNLSTGFIGINSFSHTVDFCSRDYNPALLIVVI